MSLLLAWGCGQTPTAALTETPRSQTVTLAPVSAPLTSADIAAFLTLSLQFPGSQAPSFASAELPRLTSPVGLRTAVQQLRAACRDALNPARQGAFWRGELALQPVFDRAGVEPAAFAALTLRMSCAWSALTICREASPVHMQRQLEAQIESLIRRIEQPLPGSTAWQGEQTLQALEEAVALSEFLGLLAQLPRESLQAVAACQHQLRTLLPKSAPGAEFVRRFESSPTIIPASFQTP